MSNRINEVVESVKAREGITYRDIAKRCGVSEQTLHSARKRETMANIYVDVFLKIAHGLGMTAEELYYGKDRKADEEARHELTAGEWHVVDVYRNDRHARRTIDHAVRDYDEDMEFDALEKKEAI